MRRVLLASVLVPLAACGSSGSAVSPGSSGGTPDAAAAPVDAGSHVDSSVPTERDAAQSDADSGPPRGTVDPQGKGGTVNRLAFTAFGDIRPSLPDVDFMYPKATVQSVVAGMAALQPEFAVATGDYMFVEYVPSSARGQLNALLDAEKGFSAPIFHTMGNHECQSFSDVNCPLLNESTNVTTFLSILLPWTAVPWFSFVVHTDFGDAKFVFIAVNAWNATQAAWLDQTMNAQTPYTFVVRHHPTPDGGKASSAEGIAASDAILDKHPVTLHLYGHVHEYAHLAANRVITGNAGAPLDSGENGYLYVVQRPDGNVVATEYREGTNDQIDTWAVTPDGLETQ